MSANKEADALHDEWDNRKPSAPNRGDQGGTPAREMTLREWVEQLPNGHLARRQYEEAMMVLDAAGGLPDHGIDTSWRVICKAREVHALITEPPRRYTIR